MGIVYSDHSVSSLADEMHRFVYLLPKGYSITVETADVEISRDIGTVLGKMFMKAGLGMTQDLAEKHVVQARALNFPITCTLKLDATIH